MAKNPTKLAGTETEPGRVKRPAHTNLYRDGREYPDPTPVAPPIGFIKQPTMAETMRAMIQSQELRRAAAESGQETFEEADDFNVGDDYDPTSPYEEQFEPLIPGPNIAEEIATAIHSKFTQEKPAAKTDQNPPPPTPKEQGREAPPNPLTDFLPETT